LQHGRIAIYHVKPEHNLDDVSRIAEEGMLPIFRNQPGFVGYGLVKVDEGQRLVSLSFWETEAEAETAVPLAADFVRSKLAEYIQLEENHVGDLTFYSSGEKLGA
jgi:deoxycytidine triphosphate deaminase